MSWTPRLKAEFRDALLDRYRSVMKLRIFLADAIGADLNRLTSNGNLEEVCYQAIEELDAQGELDALYLGFRAENPNKPFSQRSDLPPRDTLEIEIDELRNLRSNHKAQWLKLNRQLGDEPENFDEILGRIKGYEQLMQELDRQIEQRKREQLPPASESLMGGILPPQSQSGGNVSHNTTPQVGRSREETRSPKPQACIDPPAYLLFSVFNSQNYPGERVRVNAELQFYDQETDRIQAEAIDLPPGEQSNDTIDTEQTYAIAELADCLDRACNDGVQKLAELKQRQPFKPFKRELVVALFLPIELLSRPLQTWCCQFPDLPKRYPVVVRSSDRFQGTPRDAIYYQERLEAAWQQFFPGEQARVSQISESPKLSDLPWLASNESCCTDFEFEEYAGLQCLGHWLTPDSEGWGQLIEAGMPFAFWLYDCNIVGKISPEKRQAIFQRLTAGDRFDLLKAIRSERRSSQSSELKTTGGYHLGVFYEDINYSPSQRPPLEWAS